MNIMRILTSFYNNLDGEDIILLAIIFLVQNSKKADQAFLGMLTYIFLKDFSLKKARTAMRSLEAKPMEQPVEFSNGRYYYSGGQRPYPNYPERFMNTYNQASR